MNQFALPLMVVVLLEGILSVGKVVNAWTAPPQSVGTAYSSSSRSRRRTNTAVTTNALVICQLNRFLFDASEVDYDQAVPTVTLPKDDYRTVHAAKILSLHNGDTVRSGIVSSNSSSEHEEQEDSDRGVGGCGLITDQASIQWIPEGKVKKAEPLANGKPPGSLRVFLHSLHEPRAAQQQHQQSVALILALPRPLQLGRMLPMIAQMGVDTLVLTEARKVPKDYFGSHLFRKPKLLTERLIEGLCQAGDVRLPKLVITRSLLRFLRDDLDAIFPSTEWARVVAHPQRTGTPSSDDDSQEAPTTTISTRIRDVSFPNNKRNSNIARRMVVAVGPEGGWEEPDELDLFVREHGFCPVTMGPRILRSDCAVVSLLGLAHDACAAAAAQGHDDNNNYNS